jgi:hypothetical protein
MAVTVKCMVFWVVTLLFREIPDVLEVHSSILKMEEVCSFKTLASLETM